MKQPTYAISEWPEKTLLSRAETAQILGIGLSTLDSLVSYIELPRTVIHKRVLFHRKDVEAYINACRVTTQGGKQ
ncbi:MAG: helix-turn-helix domain-containing protein [Treponema sp.]|jgi:predicted DNA-binding transcriptional regulator AlpA|nr:helix-turn-helix domain-containing protein [Treponema sp.]